MDKSVSSAVLFLQSNKKLILVLLGVIFLFIVATIILSNRGLLPSLDGGRRPTSARELEEHMKILQNLAKETRLSNTVDDRARILEQLSVREIDSEEHVQKLSDGEKTKILEALSQNSQ